jgi:diguanylate cyclase (GGDEF)-like protein
LTSVREIGLAIATELRQLIDYHNVRVYRLAGEDLIPVAMQGQVGEYVDETPEQLMVKFGQGITGWVAEHRLAQNLPDAGSDPRANTIPGTEEDLDESMLLAPMTFEDQVLGVLVLSKLGLHQFSDDDLRLLVIYASFAAQAFANAIATERLRDKSEALERQLVNQRGLLQVTESILTTLEPQAILKQVSDRLAELVGYDNIAIEIVDPTTGLLTPLTARGVHEAEYLEPWAPGEEGLATWVVGHNESVLVLDERSDPRVNQFRSTGPLDGSLICVPLRGRDGATGVLTLERLGVAQRYTEDEFELVKLFAAQVSIALQNAEVHRAVEIRAQTDDLTSLLNHGTFQDWLDRSVESREPFSLIMLDLDDFKAVNDALGHQAGDRMLSELAKAIVGAGRDTDRVFRYGGDEFAVILPGTDSTSALAVAERIRGAIHAIGGPGTTWADQKMDVSVSIGLATFPLDGLTSGSILLAADRACFVAKRTGRGLIATADEGLAIAREFSLQEPTPVDPPTTTAA